MKNNALKLIGFIFISTLLIGASKPSIEGRASVAAEGDLPTGMYIKAHTFLPGDTVIITNPSTRVSVEVFVFETIDEGVAAIVSQEVADRLFIKNNADTIVQIQKVIAPTDIADTGLLIENEPELVEAAVAEEFVDDSEIYVPEEVIIAQEVEEYSEVDPFEEEPVVEFVIDSTDDITEVIVANETYDEVQASEEADENALVFTPFSDMTSLFATEPITNEEIDDVIEEDLEVTVFDVPVIEEIVQEEFVEESLPVEEVVILEEKTEEAIIVEELVEEIVQEDIIEEPVVVEESLVEDEIEVSIFAEPVIEEVVEEIAIVEEPIIEEIEEVVVQEDVEDDTEITLVIETPNTLSPTEENPPENVGIEDEPEVTFNTDFTLEVIEEPIEEETVDIFALTPATEYIEETPTFTGEMRDFIVDKISVQGERKFYIQLATYKDTKNIDLVLSTYSQRYPFALLQSPAVSGAYQVVVGPLTKDEYTVVLERFKSYGYKDAFLRIAE